MAIKLLDETKPWRMLRDSEPRRRDSFEDLLEPVSVRIRAFALSLTKNDHDADDLFQDAVLKALRGFGGFETGSNFGAWMKRIVFTTFVNGYRRARGRNSVVLDGIEPAVETDPVNGLGYPEAIDEELKTALDILSDECREALVLRADLGLSYLEISDRENCPIGTVMSRIHRARGAVRTHLDTVASRSDSERLDELRRFWCPQVSARAS